MSRDNGENTRAMVDAARRRRGVGASQSGRVCGTLLPHIEGMKGASDALSIHGYTCSSVKRSITPAEPSRPPGEHALRFSTDETSARMSVASSAVDSSIEVTPARVRSVRRIRVCPGLSSCAAEARLVT